IGPEVCFEGIDVSLLLPISTFGPLKGPFMSMGGEPSASRPYRRCRGHTSRPAHLVAADALLGDARLVAAGAESGDGVGGRAEILADFRAERADIGLVGVLQQAVGTKNIALPASRRERVVVDNERAGVRLLQSHD